MIEERNLHLDNANELKQKYINKLQVLTNTYYNEASSEVIYLEMMAYLSDLMNEYINSIDQRHYYKFAKLLQIPREGAACKVVLAQFSDYKQIYANEEILIDGSVYHLPYDVTLLPVLENLYHDYGSKENEIHMFLEGEYGCYPILNDEFEMKLKFSRTLEMDKIYCLYFDIETTAGRNLNRSRGFHYSEWNFYYQTKFGLSKADIIEDETFDFLYSGCIRFTLHEQMSEPYINLQFENMHYDETPIINSIRINTFPLYQERIYAEVYDYSYDTNIILTKGISLEQIQVLQKDSEDVYHDIDYVIENGEEANRIITDKVKDIRIVYQNRNIDALKIPLLKGVVKEKIQLPKDVYIKSIKLAVKRNNAYQELEVCDYWETRATKPYGCYFDREDNTITFGNGKDYLLLPANSKLLIWEMKVYEKEEQSNVESRNPKVNVIKVLQNYKEEEKITSVISKIANYFDYGNNALYKADYIRIAKSLPMSRFEYLDYIEEKQILLYDCGAAMPESFETYLSKHVNQYSLINREVQIKQVEYINVDVKIKTQDSSFSESEMTEILTAYINNTRYNNVMKLKKALSKMIEISYVEIFINGIEVFRLERDVHELFHLNSLAVSLCI